MDPDVIEIPPPSKLRKKHKQAILLDVIDIDNNDDSADLVIIGEKVSKSNKRRTIQTVQDGYGDHQVMEVSGYTSHMIDSYQPSWSLKPTNPKIQGSSVGGSNLQIKMENVDHPSQAGPSKKKSAASQHRRRDLNLSLGVESSKSQLCLGPFQSKTKSAKKATGSISSSHSNIIGHDGSFHPPGIQSEKPWLKNSHNSKPKFTNYTANPSTNPFDPLFAPPAHMLDNTWVHNSARDGNNGTALDSPVVTISDEARAEILRKFLSFKQFDTVVDTSDHYFIRNNSSINQNPKNWAKKIQEEWKILKKDLPDSIFIRVYESRMDLLRAVIVGAEGTPYHDGLFFFDVFFPSDYPNVPRQVHYHSGGLKLNPNLYHCGYVCLSLLNTWSGIMNEKWLPGVSTILQVLVSIQGLILNRKPFFNEPGHARLSGSASGEMQSLKYNEDTFILSLKTMMYMIRSPPKNFEDFVAGHFCNLFWWHVKHTGKVLKLVVWSKVGFRMLMSMTKAAQSSLKSH